MHRAPRYWAWLVYFLSVFHLPDPRAGTGNTRTTDLKCVSVAVQHTGHTTDVASSTPLRCTERGDTSGGAGFITIWKWLLCLTTVLIHEMREDSGAHKWPGLHIAMSFPGSQMQGRQSTFQRLANYFGVLQFCFSLWRGWQSMAHECVCIKGSVLLNNPDLRH